MWWKEILFTGFYTGYSPIAPGTAGTILAFLIYVLEFTVIGNSSWIINLIIVLLLLYPSIRFGDAGEVFFNKKDPSEIVLDEMMGFWISVLFYPFNWKIALLAFFIFRIMDIFKPYPIRKCETLKGGFGIMLDDYISGIYTNIIILIVAVVSDFAGIKIISLSLI